MKRTINELVENWYKNSPDWPLERPADIAQQVADFMADDCSWPAAEVRAAIVKFWDQVEQAATVRQSQEDTRRLCGGYYDPTD
jgi:hypothetical protein